MNIRQQLTVKRSVKQQIFWLAGCLLLIVFLGFWFSFQVSKTRLYHEIQTRGELLAQNVSSLAGFLEDADENNTLDAFIENVLQADEELRYVVILDRDSHVRISKNQSAQDAISFPEEIRKTTCSELPELSVTSYYAGEEPYYNIGNRIVPRERSSQGQSVEECFGIVHIGISLQDLNRTLRSSLAIAGTTFILVGLILVIGYRLLTQRILTPVLTLSEIALRISEGDLRQTIEVTSQTEIGMLEMSLSQVLQSFHAVTRSVKEACEEIKTLSDEILSLTDDPSSASEKQLISIHRIHQTLEETSHTSKQISHHADSVAEETESMLRATLSIEEILKKTIVSMKEIHEQVGKNTERVVLLGEKIAQINNVVKIINTIADQTRLIAFNASIEAAGAGEAGGRFSVVATEVRRLASTVVESLEEIRGSVSSIQTATSELILSSETGIRKVRQGDALITEIGKTLQQITERLDSTTKSARDISLSINEQHKKHAMIIEDMKDISIQSQQSCDASNQTAEIVRKFLALAQELDSAVTRHT